MLNDLSTVLLSIWGVMADVMYFCAGGIVFIVLLSSQYITKDMDKNGARVYTICTFIVWCWVFSKLIVL